MRRQINVFSCHLICHALEILFMSLFWFGQGVSWGGHTIFCVLCFLFLCGWLGMVLNQGQLSIVVSDWEPYLGTVFPTCGCGRLTLFRALCFWASRFIFVVFSVFFGVILIKIKKMHAHHAAPWSSPSNSRDMIIGPIPIEVPMAFSKLLVFTFVGCAQ